VILVIPIVEASGQRQQNANDSNVQEYAVFLGCPLALAFLLPFSSLF